MNMNRIKTLTAFALLLTIVCPDLVRDVQKGDTFETLIEQHKDRNGDVVNADDMRRANRGSRAMARLHADRVALVDAELAQGRQVLQALEPEDLEVLHGDALVTREQFLQIGVGAQGPQPLQRHPFQPHAFLPQFLNPKVPTLAAASAMTW